MFKVRSLGNVNFNKIGLKLVSRLDFQTIIIQAWMRICNRSFGAFQATLVSYDLRLVDV